MSNLPLLIFNSVFVPALLFACTWGPTRRSPWRVKLITGLLGWLVLAFAEGFVWAVLNIDHLYPRPDSPWLVPANVIFAALWLFVALASLSKMARSRITKGLMLTVSAFAVIGAIVTLMWPREPGMSSACEDHLRHQWSALQGYAKDHKGKLPPSPGTGWARLARPYYRYRPDLLKCPKDRSDCDTSYVLTSQAAGKTLDELDVKTILLIENRPRHNGKAHALLWGEDVIGVEPRSGKIPRRTSGAL